MSRFEQLPPNFDKLDHALRSVGYRFEVAVADIIDNSIDAGAQNVVIRIVARPDGSLDLVIWDDGRGMSADTLREAMRFGSDISEDVRRLGKFGLGLKLASMSQAKSFHVISFREGAISGRASLEDAVARGFSSKVYEEEECRQIAASLIPDLLPAPAGTLVWWSRLYRIGATNAQSSQKLAQKLLQKLQQYLALVFHRFLSGASRKVSIRLDIFDQQSAEPGIPVLLDPLDPFGYSQSGRTDFPARLLLGPQYDDRIKVTAHIWPPNMNTPDYRLPGGTNARQGFYFYRNDRLIQGGGWNGLREAEAHSALARLSVDIAEDFDLEVSLDVKKVEIQLPQDLADALQKSKTESGTDFRKYLSVADATYRKRALTQAELPLIPSQGLPADLIKILRDELRIEGTSKSNGLKFIWADMPKDTFFEIDRNEDSLYINKKYRKLMLHGTPGSSADAPVFKCLMFFALEDALLSERTGSRMRERLDRINRILVRAVRHERLPK